VIEILLWTAYAHTTSIAVEVLLPGFFVVEHFAVGAIVVSELNLAFLAGLGWLLDFSAFVALYLLNVPRFHPVLEIAVLLEIQDVIVAKSARIELFARRAFQRAAPLVVPAPKLDIRVFVFDIVAINLVELLFLLLSEVGPLKLAFLSPLFLLEILCLLKGLVGVWVTTFWTKMFLPVAVRKSLFQILKDCLLVAGEFCIIEPREGFVSEFHFECGGVFGVYHGGYLARIVIQF